ncbi:MAG: tRNA (adenosine(37)-N6)-threonylcarbamoyltransferase complex dimerization subunit type 1 TsaB [Planctomycetaceae bacterium]
MLVLGIETSRQPGSVALRRDSRCLARATLDHDGLRHAQALPPVVAKLLQDHALTTADINLIAISHGPGSFTGLRVGIAFAKTLAWSTRCQLVAVDTFAAIAAHAPSTANSICVATDAQRQQLFVRYYRRQHPETWTPDGNHAIVNTVDWCGERTPADTIITPDTQVLEPHFDNAVTATPDAQTIAQLGQLAADEGRLDNPVTLEPLYLRQSAAEELRRRNSTGKNPKGD